MLKFGSHDTFIHFKKKICNFNYFGKIIKLLYKESSVLKMLYNCYNYVNSNFLINGNINIIWSYS